MTMEFDADYVKKMLSAMIDKLSFIEKKPLKAGEHYTMTVEFSTREDGGFLFSTVYICGRSL